MSEARRAHRVRYELRNREAQATTNKTCPGCGVHYPDAAAAFHRDVGARDGLQGRCIACSRRRAAQGPVRPPAAGKTCRKCGVHYPDAAAGFYRCRRQGYEARCRACCAADARRRRVPAEEIAARRAAREAERARIIADRQANGKECRRCGARKPAECFAVSARMFDGLNTWCTPCTTAARLERLARPGELERIAAKARETGKTCTGCGEHYPDPASGFAYSKREGFLAKCRACRAAAWKALSPEQRREQRYNARALRRARLKNAPGSHTLDDVRRQYQAQGGRCYWCTADLGDDFHADHLVPLARGGSDYPENIVCACPSCNLSKNAKTPDEYRAWLSLRAIATRRSCAA